MCGVKLTNRLPSVARLSLKDIVKYCGAVGCSGTSMG